MAIDFAENFAEINPQLTLLRESGSVIVGKRGRKESVNNRNFRKTPLAQEFDFIKVTKVYALDLETQVNGLSTQHQFPSTVFSVRVVNIPSMRRP